MISLLIDWNSIGEVEKLSNVFLKVFCWLVLRSDIEYEMHAAINDSTKANKIKKTNLRPKCNLARDSPVVWPKLLVL